MKTVLQFAFQQFVGFALGEVGEVSLFKKVQHLEEKKYIKIFGKRKRNCE